MKIVYKYRIGQKVKIIKNDYYLLSDKKFIDGIVGKEVEIIERGFIYEDDSSHRRRNPKDETRSLQMFYYIKDGYREFPGSYVRIYEDMIEGVSNYEEVEEHVYASDGNEIIPFVTRLYSDVLIKRDENTTVANTRFSFANEGMCVGIKKNGEFYKNKEENHEYEVKIAREFLCYYIPKNPGDEKIQRQDSAAYGSLTWEKPRWGKIFTKIPDNYPEIFVDTLFSHDFYGENSYVELSFRGEKSTAKDRIEWLKHFGVYEKVYQLFLERLNPEQKALLADAERMDEFIINAKDEICKLSNKEIIALSKIIDEVKNTFDVEYN
jgi:hypothetical protein